MTQFGEKVLVPEKSVRSCASRQKLETSLFMIMIIRGAVLCVTSTGVVRVKRCTRQTLNDASKDTNWDGLCDTPGHMMVPHEL